MGLHPDPRWLANLDHEIGRNTVKRILLSHGMTPAPEPGQRTPWKAFLQAHWDGLAATDLFTVEVLTLEGLKRYLVLFVIELRTRHVCIAGIHPQPDGAWMEQMARNLTDPGEGFLRTSRYLLRRPPPPVRPAPRVARRMRLGGLLNFYHREAA